MEKEKKYPFKHGIHNDELYRHFRTILDGPFDKTFVDCGRKGEQRWFTADVLATLQKTNNWPTITFDGLTLPAVKYANAHLTTNIRILNIYLKNRFHGHTGVTAIDTRPIWWCLSAKSIIPAVVQELSSDEEERDSAKLVDDLIELSNPAGVNAIQRIQIHNKKFGATRADGGKWTRDEIVFKFKDMIGHGKVCLVHGLQIKSQSSSYHCKYGSKGAVCGPCKVTKVLKQVGAQLNMENLESYNGGGIPRMILDLATRLKIQQSDYRDLQLIFTPFVASGMKLDSCITLWTICSSENPGYLVANKRFLGCLMAAGYRPTSDSINHAASKGLANLWHPTDIWQGGKYLKFTQTTRYNNSVSKIEERSEYEADVIDKSIKHVETRTDWKKLAQKCWYELCKCKAKDRSRVMEEEEDEVVGDFEGIGSDSEDPEEQKGDKEGDVEEEAPSAIASSSSSSGSSGSSSGSSGSSSGSSGSSSGSSGSSSGSSGSSSGSSKRVFSGAFVSMNKKARVEESIKELYEKLALLDAERTEIINTIAGIQKFLQ
jgi:uncharacterized membrane protein YgcG